MADAGAREVAEHLLAKRKKSQPLSAASCGCIFRNPGAGAPSAGALIDRAGLKGLTVGGATVSPVHANFLVNSGGQTGTAADILQLIKVVKEKVCVWGGGALKASLSVLPSPTSRRCFSLGLRAPLVYPQVKDAHGLELHEEVMYIPYSGIVRGIDFEI